MGRLARVAIVGGGIAGLTLAAALDPERYDVALVEGQPERSGVGAALALWPSAVRALSLIGVTVGASAPRLSSGALFDLITGERLLPAPQRADSLALVSRPALLEALEASVPASVRRIHETVTEPAALDADLVVGADGVRSQVRGLVHPRAAERRETPWLALRGIRAEPPSPRVVGEYWGPGRLFGIAPVGAGAYWFSTHESALGPEPLDVGVALVEARDRFADAAPAVREMLAGAGPHTLATRLWVTPPMPRYARGRYVVIGDAAHATTPNLGRGAVDAILDAVSLADTLNRGGDLGAWQLRRLPVTQLVRVAAPLVMRVAVARRGAGARNALLRGAGARVEALTPLGGTTPRP